MKKLISEQTKRILEIMSRMPDQGIITELNVQYMNMLLDKISSTGMESLSDHEKEALQKLSNDEEANPPEVHSLDQTQELLRFTAQNMETGEPLVSPEDNGETYGESKLKDAYIQGEAEQMAGFDLPVFIDGDLSQLDKPEAEQQIRMLLPHGEYECVARTVDEGGVEVNAYMLSLKVEEDDDSMAGLNELELGEMEDYNIDNIGNPPEDLRNYEMGEGDDIGE